MATKRTAQNSVREKFDRTLIQDILEFPGGAIYALTVPMKFGQNVMTYSTMSNDFHVLYDCKYNDTLKHWEKTVAFWKRMRDKEGMSTRIPKLTQKVWDRLDAQWKKELANQKRRAAAAAKKFEAERLIREEEEKKERQKEQRRIAREKKKREAELKRIEEEEEKERIAKEKAKKKRTRKTTTKSKSKTTKTTTKSKSTGRKTKWRDMKAKMEQDTLDAFM